MEFSLRRLHNLIRKDFLINRKFLVLSILSLFVVCALMVFLTSDGAPRGSNQVPPDAGEITYFALLVVCGSFITASMFRELRTPQHRIDFLATPASNFEKILSKWLYTLPFYIGLASAVFAIGYPIFGICVEYLADVQFVPISELSFEYYGYHILLYLILHSFIFLCSVVYNNYPIPKILLTSSVLAIVFLLVMLLITRVVMYDHFSGFFRASQVMYSKELSLDFKNWAEDLFLRLPFLFAMIGAPFLWLIAYFKMKEKEV